MTHSGQELGIGSIDVHDGEISELNLSSAALSIRILKDCSTVLLDSVNVYDFALSEIVPGMIVSEVLCWRLRDVPIGGVGSGFGFDHFYSVRGGPLPAEEFKNNLVRRYAEAYYLQVMCSFGGTISVICENCVLFNSPRLE